tara:strand:- start:330 stop:518 length:189 start_codon:yes stop_codon:yes gene_type:complete
VLHNTLHVIKETIKEETVKSELTREEAVKRLKESKSLLDDGILSQQEYDELAKKYKEIIMKN